MELTAILVQVTKEEKGTSQSGNAWKRRTAVVETIGDPRYIHKVAVTCINALADAVLNFPLGTLVKIQLDADSRFFENRWYTDLRAWQIKPAYSAAAYQAAPAQNEEMMLDADGNVVPQSTQEPKQEPANK